MLHWVCMEFRAAAGEGIQSFAQALIKHVEQTPSSGASVVTLSGDLGAGKTHLTKVVATELGVSDEVVSPTFTLRHDYETTHPTFKTLTHIDAYRFEKVEEIDTIGWEDIVGDSERLIILEWPQRVEGRIPAGATPIDIGVLDDEVRSYRANFVV